jgi:succinate dehydrogenase / fumarate reductase, cytochrome b subunit
MTTEQHLTKKPRPVNLNLFTFHYPITAIASILHRISGVILFLFVPFLVWVLSLTLASPDDFSSVQHYLTLPVPKVLVWVFLSGLIYHLLAGMRHLVMDFGVGESLRGGRVGAWVVTIFSVILAILLGLWLW